MFETLRDANFMQQFSFIHVSPPCQLFSQTRFLGKNSGHVDLLTPLRPWFSVYDGVPWIIENVPQAPLHSPIQLCGSNFSELVGFDPRRQLRRHRAFEVRGFEVPKLTCNHNGFRPLGVYGVPGKPVPKGGDIVESKEEGHKIMGIDWMLWGELREAIPPAYTEYIGQYLMKELAA
jgi:DNA (cytosine-5)-methyltransferase 1